jgi:hypothetical protein
LTWRSLIVPGQFTQSLSAALDTDEYRRFSATSHATSASTIWATVKLVVSIT